MREVEKFIQSLINIYKEKLEIEFKKLYDLSRKLGFESAYIAVDNKAAEIDIKSKDINIINFDEEELKFEDFTKTLSKKNAIVYYDDGYIDIYKDGSVIIIYPELESGEDYRDLIEELGEEIDEIIYIIKDVIAPLVILTLGNNY